MKRRRGDIERSCSLLSSLSMCWALGASSACSRDSPEVDDRRAPKRSAVIENGEPSTPIVKATAPTAPTGIAAPTGSAVTTGTLDIDTKPQTDCVVDGKPMGTTPLTTTIAAGPHNVICVAFADSGAVLKASANSVVVAGGRAVVRLTL